jgi:MtN3 and saliva related transmembrane protein
VLETATIIGAAAALCSTASFAPQAWKVITSRSTKGLSAKMYFLTIVAFALWLTYGTLRADWAIIAPNAICLLLSIFIFGMILLSGRQRDRVADAIEHSVSGE